MGHSWYWLPFILINVLSAPLDAEPEMEPTLLTAETAYQSAPFTAEPENPSDQLTTELESPPIQILEKKDFNAPFSLHELSRSRCYRKILAAYQATYNGQEIQFPEQFIINLPNAQLLSFVGGVVTATNRPFFDYLHEKQTTYPDWKVNAIKAALNFDYPPQANRIHETIVALASPGEGCYYHWMLEILPRLKIVEMSGIPYDKVYVGVQDRKYKQETLLQYGLTEDQIMHAESNTLLKADNIIIPSMPNIVPVTRPTWACDFVRSLFLDDTTTEPAGPRKKLYITRKAPSLKHNQRLIINEEAVFSYLEAKGFEKVTLEELSIKEQAKLFHSAEIIIAAHGAALTNLIFCNATLPVTIIEIYQPQWINDCYTSLTDQLNQDRGFQFNHIQLITSAVKLSPQDQAAQNIYIELYQLDNALIYKDARKNINHQHNHEALERFGLIDNQIFYDKQNATLQGTSLLIQSIPNMHDFTGTVEVYDMLRSLFLKDIPLKKDVSRKKLYITGKAALAHNSASDSANDKALARYLKRKGFERIVLELLPLREQARLFNTAEVIVATHGAPLSNLIFCNAEEPVTVIEVHSSDLINEYYTTLTQQLNKKRGFKFNHINLTTSPKSHSHDGKNAPTMYLELGQLDNALKGAW